jgi:hypothetical protein
MLPKPKSAGRSPSAMLVAFLRPPTLQLNKGRALVVQLDENKGLKPLAEEMFTLNPHFVEVLDPRCRIVVAGAFCRG